MTPPWLAAGAASIGAGVIHLALGPEHVVELGGLGYGFHLAAILQIGWAGLAGFLLRARRRVRAGNPGDGAFAAAGATLGAARATRHLAFAGIVINAAILAAWAMSRLVGLPAGATPWVPEAIGRADAVAAVLQGAIVLTLARSLRRSSLPFPALAGASGLGRSALIAAATVLVIGASTTVGLLPGGHAHATGDAHASGDAHRAEGASHAHAEGVDPHEIADPPVAPVDPQAASDADADAWPGTSAAPSSPAPASPLAPSRAEPDPSDDHRHVPREPDHSH